MKELFWFLVEELKKHKGNEIECANLCKGNYCSIDLKTKEGSFRISIYKEETENENGN